MEKAEYNVLVVEDDKTLGPALAEFVKKLGYKAHFTGKPDEALSIAKLQTIHFAVIDCMLPKMNGKDLATAIRAESPEAHIVMISGIYKDKNFIKEVSQKVNALSFLTKPFELEALQKLLESSLKVEEAVVRQSSLIPIHEIMSRSTVSPKERINAINESDPVHGYDLPWVYSLLLDGKISGNLNLITADGEVSGVSFSQGNIVQVMLSDHSSYFGALLVEKGFISSAELDAVLESYGGKIKRMGERLVEHNVLSPHAIDVVAQEQLAVRLAKTVANTSLKINFIRSDDIRQDALLTKWDFSRHLDDWIQSKVDLDWMRSFYVPWMNYTVRKGAEHADTHPILGGDTHKKVPNLLKECLTPNLTLEQMLMKYEGREEDFYRGFHSLLISRLVAFGDAVRVADYGPQRKRLEKLDIELEKQNYFERLGVSKKAKDIEIKRNYHELAKVLHPDKLNPETPTDVRDLTKKAFEKITVAYECLTDEKKKTSYLLELEKGSAEAILRIESIKDEVRPLMGRGEFKKALEMLEEAAKLAPPAAEIKLLTMWSKLKQPGVEKDFKLQLQIKDALAAIPPEDRMSSLFYFVKGLALKASGEIEAARKTIEHACSADPNFLDAKRELNVIKSLEKNKGSMDLKDVVGGLFKRK